MEFESSSEKQRKIRQYKKEFEKKISVINKKIAHMQVSASFRNLSIDDLTSLCVKLL
jgi:uncharacterized protein (DUF2344 family)